MSTGPEPLLLARSPAVQVQGVYFRAYTQQQAQQLGLVGWCANTAKGTVVGVARGPPEALQRM